MAQIEAGPIKFDLSHRDLMYDQGVCIRVLGDVDGEEKQLLRFDCFDQLPHYHYDPEGSNEKHDIDKTTAGHPVGWSVKQFRTNMPAMLRHAGAEELAKEINVAELNKTLDEVEETARQMAVDDRSTVTHNKGDVIIDSGAIRFGLEFRELSVGRGLAVHVLGTVAEQEIEILAFDCFDTDPHYHYGPRNKNIRIYWDQTSVPNPLRWTLDQFKDRKLSAMIQRAGYPGIVAELDEDLIQQKLVEVESTALAIEKQNA